MAIDRRHLLAGGAAGAAVAAVGLPGCEPALPELEPVEVTVTKRPWLAVVGEGAIRLRLETVEPARLFVDRVGGGGAVRVEASRAQGTVADGFGFEELETRVDEPGTYVRHEVVWDDLEPGATYTWAVRTTDGELTGSFRAPPAEVADGETVLVGFLADTMHSTSRDVVPQLVQRAPELVLHGGDIQYDSLPVDTWNGAFDTFEPLTNTAPMHFCIGNHEFETDREAVDYYERLFGGQGEVGAPRWHALSWAGVRFVLLDSESGGLGDPDSAQIAWLQTELAAHDRIVVAFHRPFFTFSKHWPRTPTARDLVHPMLVDAGVRLVLNGHTHGYEHFLVDGVHYVVDGGGGAFLYNLDESLEAMRATRPDEEALRLTKDSTYGATLLAIGPTSIEVARFDREGAESDRFTIEG